MFGNLANDNSMNNMMKYMIMSEMFKGNNTTNSMLPMMMFMNKGFDNIFDGMFDFSNINKENEDEKDS